MTRIFRRPLILTCVIAILHPFALHADMGVGDKSSACIHRRIRLHVYPQR